MRAYIIKRLVIGIILMYIIATLNFLIFQVFAPLDPISTLIDADWEPEMADLMYRRFGLDQPLHIRYLKYIQNMFTFNFGESFTSDTPVVYDMSWRITNTVLLLGSALVLTVMVGIPLGILAVSRRGTRLDVAVTSVGIFAWGIPTFFIQLLLVLFFSYYTYVWWGLRVFPASGFTSSPPPTDPVVYMVDVLWHVSLPVITLVIAGFGSWALYTRNILLDALTQDYITTARAKGLSERAVLYRHAFRSSLPPIATMITLSIPGLITGAIITEYVFTYPGMGTWYIDSLFNGDYPVVQAVMFVYGILVIAANLLADVLYGVLDPRIRVGFRR